MIVKLSCDIICKHFVLQPSYRLWIDDNLLSERRYVCNPKSEFIREQCDLNIESGDHKIRLEPLTFDTFLLYRTKINERVIAFIDNHTALFTI